MKDTVLKILESNEREEFMQETKHTQQTAPEQHKTKTRKQHECKWIQKHGRHTETNTHLLRERWGIKVKKHVFSFK